MKKIVIIILSIGILLAGCGSEQKAQVKLLDAVTHRIVTGEVSINGHKLQTQNGTVQFKKEKLNIEKSGYKTKYAEIESKESIVYLTPIAYLKLHVVNSLKKPISNALVQVGNEKAITDGNGDCTVSPVLRGKQTVKVTKKFFMSKQVAADIKSGENSIYVELPLQNSVAQKYLNSLVFPEDEKNFSFSISINGNADKEKIEHQISGKVKDYKVVEVWDKDIHYVFDNNSAFIITENGKEPVKDEEQKEALSYARNVIQKMFNIKNEADSLNISDIRNDEILLMKSRTFEKRPIEEEMLLKIKNKKIQSITIHLSSNDIENADITVQINIEEAI